MLVLRLALRVVAILICLGLASEAALNVGFAGMAEGPDPDEAARFLLSVGFWLCAALVVCLIVGVKQPLVVVLVVLGIVLTVGEAHREIGDLGQASIFLGALVLATLAYLVLANRVRS